MIDWLAYRIKIAFKHPFAQIRKIATIYFSILGVLFALIPIVHKLIPIVSEDWFRYWDFWVALFFVAFIKSIKWILSYSYSIDGKDIEVFLKVGKIEKEKEALILSTNSTFVTTMQDSIISEKSAQGAFQNKYFCNNLSLLDNQISQSLENENVIGSLTLNNKNYNKYSIGTVAKVVFDNSKNAYFFALNDINSKGQNTQHDTSVVYDAINGLWKGIAEKGHIEPELSIPLIGSGRAGFSAMTKMESFKIILESFLVQVVNSGVKITEHLNIVVHPDDLKKFDMNEAVDFLKYKCKFISSSIKSQNVGKGI